MSPQLYRYCPPGVDVRTSDGRVRSSNPPRNYGAGGPAQSLYVPRIRWPDLIFERAQWALLNGQPSAPMKKTTPGKRWHTREVELHATFWSEHNAKIFPHSMIYKQKITKLFGFIFSTYFSTTHYRIQNCSLRTHPLSLQRFILRNKLLDKRL